ncbi:MAG: Rne/Rng family ribonuclease [Pseudomonadales bacterium]|nr:Rne/Rng family ribonuclease [Pseudomonadales bacterium]
MQQELVIDVSEYETRVALYGDEILREVHIERDGRYSLTGSIYLGRVDRVVPGIQAAFVEFGGERSGFLHVRDIVPGAMDVIDADKRRVDEHARSRSEEPLDIRSVLHEGQSLLVQVSKDPIAGKGARLTTNLTVAGRYLVLMPYNDRIGVSQRIREETERERLRNLMDDFRHEMSSNHGYIIRTVAEGVPIEDLEDDIEFLERLWQQITENAKAVANGEVVYQELPLHTRAVRDLVNTNVKSIVVNDEDTLAQVKDFVTSYMPEYISGLTLTTDNEYQRCKLNEEIEKALVREVELPSGGYLLIEDTESMCTVDVNTGRFVGSKNLEDTVFKTNLEAAPVIARELRVRNIGGLVVVDFIDMDEAAHRSGVMAAFEKAFEGDPSRVQIGDFSEFGLVELSRKRTRKTLAEQMSDRCSRCGGEGIVRGLETTAFDLFRALHAAVEARVEDQSHGLGYLVRTSREVVDRMVGQESARLEHLSTELECEIRFEVGQDCGPGEFTLIELPDPQSH